MPRLSRKEGGAEASVSLRLQIARAMLDAIALLYRLR